MKARVITWLEDLRTSYWFVPMLMVGVAIILSFVTLAIDQEISAEWVQGVGFVWSGGPEGARGLLSTIAGSMITVAGVTFSITIVALSLASSQFGPRLLRNFMRDRSNQFVLGTFIATFTYSILILRTIRATESLEFVPHLSITVAMVLALASLGVLFYFVHHTALSIQAPIVIAQVARELMDKINEIFPDSLGQGEEREQAAPFDAMQQVPASIQSPGDGYVQAIDDDALIQVATHNDLRVLLIARPGHFVNRGSILAVAYPAERVSESVVHALRDVFVLGPQRTQTQDVEYLIDQLVEVAVRALSPGINDPRTAIACIDWLGAALSRFAERRFPSALRNDAQGILRVVVQHPTSFEGLLRLGLAQIHEYSQSSVAVNIRLLEMLAKLVCHTRTPTDRAAVVSAATRIHKDGIKWVKSPDDRAAILETYQQVL